MSHYRLDRLLIKNKIFNQRTGDILKALDIDPENPSYLEALGGNFERSGKLLAAANMMDRVSVLEPNRF